MRDFNPKKNAGPRKAGNPDTFNRDDSNGIRNDYAPFAKDKRARSSRPAAEHAAPHDEHRRPKSAGTFRPHASNGDSARQGQRPKRRSFNPNFTADNHPVNATARPKRTDGRTSSPARSGGYGANSEYGAARSRQAEGGKGYGKKKTFRKPGADKFPPRKKTEYPRYPAPALDGQMRLNRYIAMSGLCSRREADAYIQAGVVSVNGIIVTELGTKVSSDDVVRFNDSIVRSEKKVYIVMNKPKGYVTTVEDPHADKTVMDLLGDACTERVYPVGRLDKNSLGVLLITNDGDLAKRLTHPGYMKKKIYQVSLDRPLTKADMEQITEGIELEDGDIYADEISYVNDNKKEIGIEIHSGRNRIVRRIFEHFGYQVTKLDRVYFAGLTKKNLKRGSWRFLTPKEVSMLKSGAYE